MREFLEDIERRKLRLGERRIAEIGGRLFLRRLDVDRRQKRCALCGGHGGPEENRHRESRERAGERAAAKQAPVETDMHIDCPFLRTDKDKCSREVMPPAPCERFFVSDRQERRCAGTLS